ncbi:putative endo-beta-1,4-glucanase D [Lachnellula hyalina]|uniref:lytic cellulose monooxygenase (C4-dehydrogenating) n=1 Tax=Lachnellula hyalina TaxID=1316788 RepID=A0A8H8QYV6_9HELO|nr:putative endo-beta-1,4-glucanase D [Lachnellula hyalina]TVY24285.1 putative endo-beta-1,4-glucanase D [Lachnellula hyalina]
MKFLASFVAFSSLANAHYTFPALIKDGAATTDWQYVRQWTGYYTNSPVTDVTSLDLRCNVNASTASSSTLAIPAGSTIGFTSSPDIFHPGPLQVYMASVPSGQTAATWDGSGTVWFKIFGQGPTFGTSLTWPTLDATQVNFTVPASLPSGEYLLRVEHIALHSASSAGGAQFYISCGQVDVTGGGTGTPTDLVAFPGAYKATDPGILINIYYPVPTSYTLPGPSVYE